MFKALYYPPYTLTITQSLNAMDTKKLFNLIRGRIEQIIKLYLLVLVPMWIMFALNSTILFGYWNSFGIQPRTLSFSSIIGVFTAWMMHADLGHIIGNSIALFQMLFIFGLFEKKPIPMLLKLIVGSGFMTWGLGSNFSIHIGASGLVFALAGYLVGSAIFARRWVYMVAGVLLGTTYWLAIVQGLIPQEGISFAGHFGGLCIGLLFGADTKKKPYHSQFMSNQ